MGEAADGLLAHLSLLFVPGGVGVGVGVGVMVPGALIAQYGPRMMVALLLLTWIGLAVRALVLRAPLAMGIVAQLGGATSGKFLFDRLGITGHDLRGFALSTTCHGTGAARAMQLHPDAGTYAGLALGLQGVLAWLLLPLSALVITRWLGG